MKIAFLLLASYVSCSLCFVTPSNNIMSSRSNIQSEQQQQERIMVRMNLKGDKVEERAVSNEEKDDNHLFPHAHVAEKTRNDFKILSTKIGDDEKDLIYLDSAATSQKPVQVLQKLEDYYNKINSNVHRGAHTLSREATAEYEGARDKISSFINANNRNEVVFTSGATEALNLIAMTYGRSLQEGDEIITTEMEHHSNIVPWQILAQEKGIKVKYVKIDTTTGCLDLDQFQSLFDAEKTKLVSFQHVSNVVGCINPVSDVIVPMIRQSAHPDCKILLDACQSVPHMKVDVQELGVDFLAASGHKMCGPTGIGFLWGKEDLLNSLPPFMGGGEMIDQVTLDGSTYAQAPGRFEAGTPQIAQAIGLGAAIDYLNDIGMDNIEQYEHELSDYLYKELCQVDGVTVLGRDFPNGMQRAALCCFVCDDVHPSDLSTFLDLEGVAIRAGHHCCQPLHTAFGYSHSARASLYFYNTKEDIDVFIQSLKNTIQFFSNLEAGSEKKKINGNDDDTIECAPVMDDDEFVPFI